mgnify:CR=1 FL=1
MREWYGGDRRIERTLLVLLIRASNRTEIVLGSRARKKMRESAVRRVARRANQLLAAGGEGAVDEALRHAVTAVLKALNAVDTYCFEQQTGKQPSGAPPAEVKAQLEAAVGQADESGSASDRGIAARKRRWGQAPRPASAPLCRRSERRADA